MRLPQLHVVAVTEDLSVEQFARALALGCDGVTHSDTTAEIVVSVLEAAVRSEVVLPAEAAHLMAKAMFEDSPQPSPLTQEELQLLGELASGTTVVAIANELGWSERTMRRRIHSICLKLGVVNKSQAIAKASRIGLLDGLRD